MILLIVMICVAVVAAAIIAGIVVYNIRENDTHPAHLAWTAAGIALPMLGLIFGTFAKVGANEVGIVYDDRYGVVEKVYTEGFHTKSIFEHVKTISTINRDKFIETYAQTSDSQSACFEISITYAVQAKDAPKFYKYTSGDLKDDQLKGLVEKELQTTTINYNIFDLLSEDLEEARVKFETALASSLEDQYGITLRFAVFKDVDAGDEVEAILKAKATAQQQIEIAQKEAEANRIKAESEAEIAQIKAEADAEVQRILAQAEADAIAIKGQAEGEAASAYVRSIQGMINSLYCNVNLVPEEDIVRDTDGTIVSFKPVATPAMTYEQCASTVLSIIFYNTWDGVLPTTLTSDSLSALIGALITGNTGASE